MPLTRTHKYPLHCVLKKPQFFPQTHPAPLLGKPHPHFHIHPHTPPPIIFPQLYNLQSCLLLIHQLNPLLHPLPFPILRCLSLIRKSFWISIPYLPN
ncbi:hypothetical protein L873DRAFT_733345 [Choiromyces venosus 120613-1]|uniref:Uncharacterized protein n=1 Tax=Choiromyces venosus 120613-1 TaxID=1336337 RepID=A0A3N4IT89_9PEZI|nr:hypothetical protein L873DRAFT_733345 [Choiromyces venosus 120613-1]